MEEKENESDSNKEDKAGILDQARRLPHISEQQPVLIFFSRMVDWVSGEFPSY